MTRSVALVSATVPSPPDAGKKVVLAGLLAYWAARVGPENVHLVHVGAPDPRLDDLPVRVHLVPRPRAASQAASVAVRTVLTGRHTIQESVLYSRRARRRLADVLDAIDADVEIFDTIRMGQYAEEIPARPGQRRYCYLDDLFSRRYSRMRRALRTERAGSVDALGEFRALLPRPVARFASARPVQRMLLTVEQRLAARREVATARSGMTCLLVNPEEARLLARRAGPGSGGGLVLSVPPLVAPSCSPRAYAGGADFVLLGLLSLAHNHDAAMTFLRHVMPALLDLLPDARVQIVGRGARPELVQAAARFREHVRVTGYLPDLDALMAGTCALVAPLRFGSGLKVKVLEALARGVPVLATEVGAEGVRAAGTGVLVEQDLARYPELMAELTDPTVNARLSAAAWRHHAATYSREAAFARYDAVFAAPGRVVPFARPAPTAGPVPDARQVG